jgi:DNA invertase Pin-like site-specific DNA recombinase
MRTVVYLMLLLPTVAGDATMLDHERVLIYCRTAFPDDLEDMENQEHLCWQYLSERIEEEWDVVLTIKEVGSGLTLNRPGLQAILRPLEHLWSVEPQPLLASWSPDERPFDLVLVCSPDRLAASDVLLNKVQEKLARADVRFDFTYDEEGMMEDAQREEAEARQQEMARLAAEAELEEEFTSDDEEGEGQA